MLVKKGMQPPTFRKTGTTIDGVVLGADTRATEWPIVVDKNCEKIHYMASNIYCCGAGTAADTEAVTDMISSQLHLHRYATVRESRVVTALTLLKSHLFRYQGYVSTALVLGGVDITGPHLHTVRRIMSCERIFLTIPHLILLLYSIFIILNQSDCVDDVAYAIMLEMSKLSYKVSEADVTHARNQLKSSLQLHLDGTSPVAEDIGRQLLTYGRRLPTAELFARIDTVDASTIKRVANHFIFDQDLAIAAIGPIQKLPDYHWFRRRTYMLRY